MWKYHHPVYPLGHIPNSEERQSSRLCTGSATTRMTLNGLFQTQKAKSDWSAALKNAKTYKNNIKCDLGKINKSYYKCVLTWPAAALTTPDPRPNITVGVLEYPMPQQTSAPPINTPQTLCWKCLRERKKVLGDANKSKKTINDGPDRAIAKSSCICVRRSRTYIFNINRNDRRRKPNNRNWCLSVDCRVVAQLQNKVYIRQKTEQKHDLADMEWRNCSTLRQCHNDINADILKLKPQSQRKET